MKSFSLSLLLSLVPAPAQSADPIDLELIVRPDAHATLVNPQCSHCVDEARRRAGDLRDDDRILAWIRGKYDGGGIPYRFFLVPYRVISDTYGVFVFDPDAGFARGFEPSLDFTFYGWRRGVLVIKHKDGTLYSALSGRAFAGPRAGDRLKPVATITTDWGYWRTAHPGSVAYHMFDKYQPLPIPATASQESLKSRGSPDARLNPMDEVLGVELKGKARAYRLSDLRAAGGVLSDQLAGDKLNVLWHAATRTAAAYAPEVEDTSPAQHVEMTFDSREPSAPFFDRTTKSRFGIEGRAHDGALKGKALRWIDSVQCRWFAWSAEHPQTEIFVPPRAHAAAEAPRTARQSTTTREAILVTPDAVAPATARQWRSEGFSAIVAVLGEEFEATVYEQAARAAAASELDLYYWIEVGRNPRLADAHPEWMASLGMHDDWRRNFPKVPTAGREDVYKAYPWVPIGYRGAFEAHLDRVRNLLTRVPSTYRGLLLNDLQGGPSACGCGNLQCRWALDYHVPKTTEVLAGDDVAARWLARVESLAPAKEIIPVWTTECEEIDLAAERRGGAPTTGLCGNVGCASATCPKAFSKQWQALVKNHAGAIGLLLLEKEFGREGANYGPAGKWIAQGVDYLDRVTVAHGVPALDHERLWLVVEGQDSAAEAEAVRRRVAATTGTATVVVARTRLDQTYQPRIVRP